MAEENKCENCSGECSGNCSGNCEGCSGHKKIPYFELNDQSNIKLVLGVISGKGGVGKSLVTSLLATKLNDLGLKVGVLDADITGPSMGKSFGIKDKAYQDNGLILPHVTKKGIKVITTNMLLENDDDPIVWRGSMISSLIGQFYKDVKWGKLDVLLIDMPPGTSDVSLTIFQQIPLGGIIMVTTPQDLVSLIVKKSIHMAETMDIPLLGIVENMSYVVCPNCDEKIYVFGQHSKEELEEKYSYPLLGRIPFDKDINTLVDNGNIEDFNKDYLDDLAASINELLGEIEYE